MNRMTPFRAPSCGTNFLTAFTSVFWLLLLCEPGLGQIKSIEILCPTWGDPVEKAGFAPESGLAREVRHKKTGITLCLVPAGSFVRSSSTAQKKTEVSISKPFYLGKFETTTAEWIRAMGRRNPARSYQELGPSPRPLEELSWKDAHSYVQKIGLRLPTESEWEHACRAGSGNDRYGPLDAIAWSSFNIDMGDEVPQPVGRKRPNKFGLHDMIGNVSEWCSDVFDPTLFDAPGSTLTDPIGKKNADGKPTLRSLRGGSISGPTSATFSTDRLSASFRFGKHPTDAIEGAGVRVAMNIGTTRSLGSLRIAPEARTSAATGKPKRDGTHIVVTPLSTTDNLIRDARELAIDHQHSVSGLAKNAETTQQKIDDLTSALKRLEKASIGNAEKAKHRERWNKDLKLLIGNKERVATRLKSLEASWDSIEEALCKTAIMPHELVFLGIYDKSRGLAEYKNQALLLLLNNTNRSIEGFRVQATLSGPTNKRLMGFQGEPSIESLTEGVHRLLQPRSAIALHLDLARFAPRGRGRATELAAQIQEALDAGRLKIRYKLDSYGAKEPEVTQAPKGTKSSSEAATPPASGASVHRWGVVLQEAPTAKDVPISAHRKAITATGLPWRVRHRRSGIEFVLVPAGTFERGSLSDDPMASRNEHPRHKVVLTRPFYIGRYELRVDEWANMAGVRLPARSRGSSGSLLDVLRSGKDDASKATASHAITGLSQEDCIALFKRFGLRLPTEAEWEYACRAGSTEQRYGKLEQIAVTTGVGPVGRKRPNGFAIFDMLGNASEICSDFFKIDAYVNCFPKTTNPTGPSKSETIVTRGGHRDPKSVRAATRGTVFPHQTSKNVGVRAAIWP